MTSISGVGFKKKKKSYLLHRCWCDHWPEWSFETLICAALCQLAEFQEKKVCHSVFKSLSKFIDIKHFFFSAFSVTTEACVCVRVMSEALAGLMLPGKSIPSLCELETLSGLTQPYWEVCSLVMDIRSIPVQITQLNF